MFTELQYQNYPFISGWEYADPFTLLKLWILLISINVLVVLFFLLKFFARESAPVLKKIDISSLYVPSLFFALGLAIRLTNLGMESLDSQEFSYFLKSYIPTVIADNAFVGFIINLVAPYMVSPHAPLFRSLYFFWIPMASDDFFMRLPLAVFGALTPAFLYLWIKRDFGKQTALISAFLLVLSPFHVHYSQNTSPYALLTFIIVVIGYLHRPMLSEKSNIFVPIFYTLFVGLGFLCHLSFPAFFAPFALHGLFYHEGGDSKAQCRYIRQRYLTVCTIAFLPFTILSISFILFFGENMIVALPYLIAMKIYEPFSSVSAAFPLFLQEFFKFLTHCLSIIFGNPYTISWGVIVFLIAFTIFLLPGCKDSKEKNSKRLVAGVIASFFIFLTILGIYTIFKNKFFYFATRRFVPITPFLYVVLAYAFTMSKRYLENKDIKIKFLRLIPVLILGTVFLSQTLDLTRRLFVIEKPDIRAATQFLDKNLQDGDGIAVGPYIFFDGMVALYARNNIEDWYWIGGPSRWVKWHRENRTGDKEDISVFMSLNGMFLQWHQALEHVDLKRVWVMVIDEAPLDFRELKGEGTINFSSIDSTGFSDCGKKSFEKVQLRCFKKETKPIVFESSLQMGKNDYRQARFFAPPGQVQSNGRSLTKYSELVFKISEKDESLRLKMRVKFTSVNHKNALEKVTLQSNLYFGDVSESVDLVLNPDETVYELPLKTLLNKAGESGQTEGNLRVELFVNRDIANEVPECFAFRRDAIRKDNLVCGIQLFEAEVVAF